ncbi:MAG: DUF354 domain-containing protein [Thermoplasmata archaeon]|nr:DUF354 domain-containing protein [Thermoplasmata archaeon]
MRVMIDMGHPAHVHFFKNAIWELERLGHEVRITARDKDVTLQLLDAYGLKYTNRGAGSVGTLKKGLGMISTDFKMLKIARKFKPDIMCGILNPYTAQVSRLIGAKSITFTDTEHARSAQKMTFPFTDLIVTPEAYLSDHGEKHVRYDGYHELAYLHPKYFTPDPGVLDELGIGKDEKFVIVRFVSWEASHDIGETGFSLEDKIQLVKEIEKYATPIITSEGEMPEEFRKYQIKIPAHRIHDALYYAALYVGEGATMASEGAVMGVPAIYTNNLKLGYMDDQESYGLVFQYSPNKESVKKIIEDIRSIFQTEKTAWNDKKDILLNEKIDVTSFMVWLMKNHLDINKIMKEDPDYQNKFK